jgi:hypothetical protein
MKWKKQQAQVEAKDRPPSVSYFKWIFEPGAGEYRTWKANRLGIPIVPETYDPNGSMDYDEWRAKRLGIENTEEGWAKAAELARKAAQNWHPEAEAIFSLAVMIALFLGLGWYIWDFYDYPDLGDLLIDGGSAAIASMAQHKLVIGLSIALYVAVLVLPKLPRAIGWIAGRLFRAVREGFQKGLSGKEAGKFSLDPRSRD